jgi:hypothetical protein
MGFRGVLLWQIPRFIVANTSFYCGKYLVLLCLKKIAKFLKWHNLTFAIIHSNMFMFQLKNVKEKNL